MNRSDTIVSRTVKIKSAFFLVIYCKEPFIYRNIKLFSFKQISHILIMYIYISIVLKLTHKRI